MTDEILFLALATQEGLARRQAHKLLERFGSPGGIYSRAASELRAHCSPGAAASLARGPDLERARADVQRAERLGLQVVVPGASGYPEALASIPDPPLALWVRGHLPDARALAIVGARRATPRGREVARRLARAASEAGVAVVSGLAYGIDAAAHRGALEAGGSTFAVLASGLDRPSPKANLGLAQRMLMAGGGWLSEYPPGTPAAPFRFPERNRLISGLAGALLVVEAGDRSGSLWTVRHALEQGRDVLSVPGPVDTSSCRGSNALLRDGAGVILDERDLLDWIAPLQSSAPEARGGSVGFSEDARLVLGVLGEGPTDSDEVGRRSGFDAGRLAVALLELELAGRVARDAGRLLLTGR